MKAYIILIITILFSFQHLQCQEQQIFSCWDSVFQTKGIDIKIEMSNFEGDLIKNKLISDNSWTSYKNLIDSLSNERFPMINRTVNLDNFIKESELAMTSCKFPIEDTRTTKYSIISNEILEISNEVGLNFNNIYKSISKSITPKDFQTDFYKTWICWILISNTVDPNLFKQLVPEMEEQKTHDFIVEIDSNLNYYIDNIKVGDIKEIQRRLDNLPQEFDNSIGFKVHKSIKMEKVIEIMNMCKENGVKLIIL